MEPDLDTRDPRDAIRLQYRRFQLLMARAGLSRTDHETPDEYGEGPLGKDDILTAKVTLKGKLQAARGDRFTLSWRVTSAEGKEAS